MSWIDQIAPLWSTTRFGSRELSGYAERIMIPETRSGIRTISVVLLLPLLASLIAFGGLGWRDPRIYTCALVAGLALHIYVSSRWIDAIPTLHALGVTLLVVAGTAFALLAHREGEFGSAVFGSVVMLFMLIPMVPWGLREASAVTLLVYSLFALSSQSVPGRFDFEAIIRLQLFMFAAGALSLTLVARTARVRKDDIIARHEIENAHREMETLSLQDSLTGMWNRRFLEAEFAGYAERARKAEGSVHFALLDLDRFKQLNDSEGHAVGDQALKAVAAALQQAVCKDGFAARTGGDEFALLICGEDPELRLEAATAPLRLWAQEAAGGAAGLSISAGIVTLPRNRSAPLDEAYRTADRGLYVAKRSPAEAGKSLRVVRGELAKRAPRAKDESGAS